MLCDNDPLRAYDGMVRKRLSRFLWTLSLVQEDQRYRVRAHPHGYAIAVGVLVAGVVGILFPGTIEETATSLALPEWLRTLFEICWATGGALATIGIARGYRGIEAGGMGLLATALFVDYLAFIYIRPAAAVSGLFVLILAIASAERSYFLAIGARALVAKLVTRDEALSRIADADEG